MADSLRLEMKPSPPDKPRFFLSRSLLVCAFAALFGLSAVAGWWLAQGRVSSVSATLDTGLYPVAPAFSAKLEEITVREGDRVTANQPLGRMDASAYARQLREAGSDAAALRPTLMEETAERLRALQASEKAIVERLAQARNEEEAQRRIREDRVTEHVRAQLALRALDAQGGERAVGRTRYQDARQAEAQARASMDVAKDDFERVSRMRAVADQELRRIREEGLNAPRSGSSEARVQPVVDGTLYAPVSGTVVRTAVKPGQMVGRGQAVLLIRPEGDDADNTRVTAYFPLKAKDSLDVGQPCDVKLDDENDVVRGDVVEIMTPRTLPGDARSTETMGAGDDVGLELYVPVRIHLRGRPAHRPRHGGHASSVVRTRSLFGFRGF